MTTAEEWRRKANEAEEAAERCNDILTRRLFRRVAQEWHEIAELCERNVL
jgi:hypothetical protein